MAKGYARTFAQDLMRGEHVVGGGQGVTEQKPKFRGGLADGLHALREAQKAGLPEPEDAGQEQTGTSIFDPVLCELAYRWFCPLGGTVLDPFAGGSVRGVVACLLGRNYVGIELRPEQIESNRAQADAICNGLKPVWVEGDSVDCRQLASGWYDFLFSCPPYGDLERYSDDPRDISTLGWPAFVDKYRAIIRESAILLRDNRFACFVVGDFRDKRGNYRDFVSTTIAAFKAAGLELYNEAILVTAVGSLSIRVPKQFQASRKLGKTHQNVLVFVKGSGELAAKQLEATA